MDELDALYSKLLTLGFVVLRQAVESEDRQWIQAELEMLHNIPSLLGEPNPERHLFYWFSERPHYIDWASAPEREQAKSRMLTFYEPVWREMEPLVADLIVEPVGKWEGAAPAKPIGRSA